MNLISSYIEYYVNGLWFDDVTIISIDVDRTKGLT